MGLCYCLLFLMMCLSFYATLHCNENKIYSYFGDKAQPLAVVFQTLLMSFKILYEPILLVMIA